MRQLLNAKIRDAYMHPQFVTDVSKPLNLEAILDFEVGGFLAFGIPRSPIFLLLSVLLGLAYHAHVGEDICHDGWADAKPVRR